MNLDQKNIVAMLGIENLPEERKLSILEKMTNLLEKRLMVRAIGALSEPLQKKFAEVLEKNQPDQMQEFVAKNLPQFNDWVSEEVNTLKQELEKFGKI